jgi:HTH-type transcriptional regulator / antitoxin HipB
MFLTSTKELGELIKKTRKSQNMTQSELAGACGTGVRFIVDLEKGKPTSEIEKVLLVMTMLGIKLEAHEPEDTLNG